MFIYFMPHHASNSHGPAARVTRKQRVVAATRLRHCNCFRSHSAVAESTTATTAAPHEMYWNVIKEVKHKKWGIKVLRWAICLPRLHPKWLNKTLSNSANSTWEVPPGSRVRNCGLKNDVFQLQASKLWSSMILHVCLDNWASFNHHKF